MSEKPNELFSRDKLIAWLRKQDPSQGYVWSDPVFCLMGRYVTEEGTAADLYGYSEVPDYHEIAETKPHTFGAALQRALECREAALALPSPLLQIEHQPQVVEHEHAG